jgi:hypothetical protein
MTPSSSKTTYKIVGGERFTLRAEHPIRHLRRIDLDDLFKVSTTEPTRMDEKSTPKSSVSRAELVFIDESNLASEQRMEFILAAFRETARNVGVKLVVNR